LLRACWRGAEKRQMLLTCSVSIHHKSCLNYAGKNGTAEQLRVKTLMRRSKKTCIRRRGVATAVSFAGMVAMGLHSPLFRHAPADRRDWPYPCSGAALCVSGQVLTAANSNCCSPSCLKLVYEGRMPVALVQTLTKTRRACREFIPVRSALRQSLTDSIPYTDAWPFCCQPVHLPKSATGIKRVTTRCLTSGCEAQAGVVRTSILVDRMCLDIGMARWRKDDVSVGRVFGHMKRHTPSRFSFATRLFGRHTREM